MKFAVISRIQADLLNLKTLKSSYNIKTTNGEWGESVGFSS